MIPERFVRAPYRIRTHTTTPSRPPARENRAASELWCVCMYMRHTRNDANVLCDTLCAHVPKRGQTTIPQATQPTRPVF